MIYKFQVDLILTMISSLVTEEESSSLVEEDPEDFADEQGLLARCLYIFYFIKIYSIQYINNLLIKFM